MGFTNRIFHFIASSFLTLIIAYGYSRQMDFSLNEPGALIGIATLKGVDVGQRIHQFYTLLFVVFSAFLIAFFSIQKWGKEFHSWTFPLSILGVFSVIQSFVFPENFSVALSILGVCVWIQFPLRNEVNRWFYLLLSISFSLFAIQIFVLSGVEMHDWGSYLIGFVFLSLSLIFDNKTPVNSDPDQFALLVFLPIVGPLSTEIFLILNQHQLYFTTPLGWFLLVTFLLLALQWFFYRKLKADYSRNTSIFTFGFALSIFTFLFYAPHYTFWGDLFELANPAHAAMQHFVFGEWPFIDYFSSHVLSEQIPQWIYVMLNGYSGDLGFMTYTYFNNIVGWLIGYWFFARILGPKWAIAIVFLFPFINTLIPPTFIMGLFTLYFLSRYFSEKRSIHLYGLLSWIVFITLWRIDFGASIIPAVALLFLLEWIQVRNWKDISGTLLRGGLFIGIVGSIAVIIHFSFGETLVPNLALALDYLGASQAHGYEEITKSYTTIYFLHYYVFPVVSVIILAELVLSNWCKQDTYSFLQLSVLFLGLIYVFNAQRGLVRHGFNEDYDLYISSVFFLFISTWILTWVKGRKGIVFVVLSFLLILGFHFPNVDNEQSFGANIFERIGEIPTVSNTSEPISRVRFTEDVDQEKLNKVSDYILSRLDSEETFIDFTHSPMWYFFTHKEVPSYFNQYMQNLVSPNLQKHNVEQLENIGLVVFGHSPRNPLDVLDGVPNELRYLYVTEYIYSHFSPAEVVEGYRMWWPTEKVVVADVSSDVVPVMRDHLYTFPEYLGKTSDCSKVADVIMDGNEMLLFDHHPSVFDAFEISFQQVPEGVKHSGWIQYFDGNGGLLGEVEFEIIGNSDETKFLVPIGYQYLWQSGPIEKIQFFYPDYLRLQNVQLVAYEP